MSYAAFKWWDLVAHAPTRAESTLVSTPRTSLSRPTLWGGMLTSNDFLNRKNLLLQSLLHQPADPADVFH